MQLDFDALSLHLDAQKNDASISFVLDAYKIIIKPVNAQKTTVEQKMVYLFFNKKLQPQINVSNVLLSAGLIDGDCALIHHEKYGFGLQAVYINNINDIKDTNNIKNSTKNISKTSTSAQAKALLQSHDLHSELFLSNSFDAAAQKSSTSSTSNTATSYYINDNNINNNIYREPIFKTIEALCEQADFMFADIL